MTFKHHSLFNKRMMFKCSICSKTSKSQRSFNIHLNGLTSCSKIILQNQHTSNIDELKNQHTSNIDELKNQHTIKIDELNNIINELKNQHTSNIDELNNNIIQKDVQISHLHEIAKKPIYNLNVTCQTVDQYLNTKPGITFRNEPHHLKTIKDKTKRVKFNNQPFNLYEMFLKMYTYNIIDDSFVIMDKHRKIIVVKYNGRVKELDKNPDFRELCHKMYIEFYKDNYIDSLYHHTNLNKEIKKLKQNLIQHHSSNTWSDIKKNNQLLPNVSNKCIEL
jgi:hypothetical protein